MTRHDGSDLYFGWVRVRPKPEPTRPVDSPNASCLLNGLRWVELKCVKRSANLVAHLLARYAREVSDEVIWLEHSPPLAMEALYLNSISIQWMKVWILFHKEKKNTEIMRSINCNLTTNFGVSMQMWLVFFLRLLQLVL